MKKLKFVAVGIFAICLLATLCIMGIGEQTGQANAYSANNDETRYTYYGYDLDNLLPFRDFAKSLGYVFTDLSTHEEFAENFMAIYWGAIELGIIVPLENDILLVNGT